MTEVDFLSYPNPKPVLTPGHYLFYCTNCNKIVFKKISAMSWHDLVSARNRAEDMVAECPLTTNINVSA